LTNALIRLAVGYITHRKLRSWLTTLGIIIGIASIVALVTVSEGLETAIEEQFEQFGVSIVRVVPRGLRGAPTETSVLSQDDTATVKKVKGLEYVAELFTQNGKVEYNNKENLIMVQSLDPKLAKDAFYDLNFEIDDGRILEPGDTSVAIVGATLGDDLFDKEILVKNSIKIEDKKFRVVGVFKETGTIGTDNIIFTPIETTRNLFNEPNAVTIIAAKVQEGLDVEEIREKIESKLKRARDNEDFDVITPAQIIEQLSLILGVVQFILIGIAAISLVVGGIGIMNSMYTSVLERTRDIGIMKSIGAKNSDVLMIFVFEAGIFGLVGGLVGGIGGTAVSFLIKGIAKVFNFGLLSISVNYGLIVFATLFAFAVGVIAGLAPAYRAAKLKPVDALRYE